MKNQIIYLAIELALMVVMYLLGKYVAPKLLTDSTFKVLTAWVYKFVVSAENQYGSGTGEEKREYVTELIQELCKKVHIKLTDEQIRALIEEAVNTMKETF